jgi:hypothetical protein
MARKRKTKTAAKIAGLNDPTPERLLKAGKSSRKDAAEVVHFEDTLLERLAARGALEKDAHRNRVLLVAGQRYFEHWYLSGMSPIGAQDLTRLRGGDGASGGMPTSELQAHHRRAYREAVRELGPYFSAVVDPIVLNEQTVESVGLRISGYRDRNKAIAVALDRLKEGLTRLAEHFRLMTLDAVRTDVVTSNHDVQKRPDGTPPRALRRHRSLAGMS